MRTVAWRSTSKPARAGSRVSDLPSTVILSGAERRSLRAVSSFLTASSLELPPMSTPRAVVLLGTSEWSSSSPAP
ncbi:hypothetical protein SAZ_27950 [Streptomyces noursei ZPM]|nr:hypothetical protein SAZ_27950 [Streptomyces noursei ZPM]